MSTVIVLFTAAAVPFAAALIIFFGFDATTAALAATPARMQDMIVLAGTTGSEALTVMLMQLARQLMIIISTPVILRHIANKKCIDERENQSGTASSAKPFFTSASMYALFLAPGLIGAIGGRLTGHILGPLLGSFALVATLRLIFLNAGEARFPKPLTFLIQTLAGMVLGMRVTPDTATLFFARGVPILAACLYVLLAGLFIARVLHSRYGWHKALSWMAAAPGRASDMIAMAQDIAFSAKERLALACIHTVRQVYFTIFISIVMIFLQ